MSVNDDNSAEIPAAAQEAWLCYVAMTDSKAAHFEYLESLEVKYQHGGTRTLAETARLENLLADHNECVQAFVAAQKSLAMSDAVAHREFVQFLSLHNAPIGNPETSN